MDLIRETTMYRLLIYRVGSNELISDTIEYVLSAVIKVANQRLLDLGKQPKPCVDFLRLQNNIQTCVAPGIYAIRMEKEVSPLELPTTVNTDINIDAIDALRSIHQYLSVIEVYRGHIPFSIPKNEKAHDYTDKFSRFMSELHTMVRVSDWLTKELAL